MIIERLTFQAKYGKGDALVAVLRRFKNEFMADMPGSAGRIYTDATGRMFTVIADNEYADVEEWTRSNAEAEKLYGTPEFGAWFAEMEPLVAKGEMQLLNVVE